MNEQKSVTMHIPTIEFHGPAATHDQACSVFHRTEKAVLNCNTGVFHPSWAARKEGWRLVLANSWWKRTVLRFVFGVK